MLARNKALTLSTVSLQASPCLHADFQQTQRLLIYKWLCPVPRKFFLLLLNAACSSQPPYSLSASCRLSHNSQLLCPLLQTLVSAAPRAGRIAHMCKCCSSSLPWDSPHLTSPHPLKAHCKIRKRSKTSYFKSVNRKSDLLMKNNPLSALNLYF